VGVVADSSGGAYPVGGVCLVHRLVLPGKGARGQRGANSIGCLGASHRLPLDTGRIANGDRCALAVAGVGLEDAGEHVERKVALGERGADGIVSRSGCSRLPMSRVVTCGERSAGLSEVSVAAWPAA